MTPLAINNIGIEKNNQYKNNDNNPHFTGALDSAVRVLKTFNDKPMIGVAFTDTVATNATRSIVDFVRNTRCIRRQNSLCDDVSERMCVT